MVPKEVEYLIIGAGIHGLSTAWRLAERLIEKGDTVDGKIVVLDKHGIAAGASGIACGVVRNNYFQPAMRNLMAHSVEVWESDPKAFSYHPVGYMQISCEPMREDVGQIFSEQQNIGFRVTCTDSEGSTPQTLSEISTPGNPTGTHVNQSYGLGWLGVRDAEGIVTSQNLSNILANTGYSCYSAGLDL